VRHSDNVFFFTLIDFLVQVAFFGLMLHVVQRAAEAQVVKISKVDASAIDRLKKATGVSNMTELTDDLSNLGPIKELKGTADFIAKSGGAAGLKKMQSAVESAGGADKIAESLERLRKYEEGSGKPPCLYHVVNGKKTAKTIATVVASDATIKIQDSTSDLADVLKKVGRSFDSVKDLSHSDFRIAFAPLVQSDPSCRYTLRFIEATNFVHARDATRGIFYLNIEKSSIAAPARS